MCEVGQETHLPLTSFDGQQSKIKLTKPIYVYISRMKSRHLIEPSDRLSHQWEQNTGKEPNKNIHPANRRAGGIRAKRCRNTRVDMRKEQDFATTQG